MSESKNTVTVEVDLEQMAKGILDYYTEMQEGQIAEMLGDTDTAFTQAKKVITIMAAVLEAAVGTENVIRVNNLVADLQAATVGSQEGE